MTLEDSRQRASRILANYNIPTITTEEIKVLLADNFRTSYVFDVRSSEEADSDPIALAVHAPCGQIVQATDQWVSVRRSRLILCCDTGLRSAIAAFWLKQLGHEPLVACIGDSLRGLRHPSKQPPQVPHRNKRVKARIALDKINPGKMLLLDLRSSMAYRSAHIRGAIWCSRPQIPLLLANHLATEIGLISDDTELTALAAIDCYEVGVAKVVEVDGGHAAMLAAGAASETTPASPTDTEAIDYLFFVHDRHEGNREASRRYLAWETGLIHQLDESERREFQLLTPITAAEN